MILTKHSLIDIRSIIHVAFMLMPIIYDSMAWYLVTETTLTFIFTNREIM